ncbi:MAG TPA: DUF992 domain-containing protein [Caulobacteraceae bacterium]|nr:DUF992 domain-containing protein [Caulobacteraceae bacterium]
MKQLLLSASLLGALALVTHAAAQTPSNMKIGVLSCHVRRGGVQGSSRPVTCFFSGDNGSGHYDGRITSVGLRRAYRRAGDIAWKVYAPYGMTGPSDLPGQYGGSGAAATGANALVGGSDDQITLRPVRDQGAAGLDLSRGVTQLSLQGDRGAFRAA